MKYVVKTGDNLTKIGKKFHVDWHKIATANHLKPPYKIHPGQKLEIPTAGSNPPVVSNPQPYNGQPIVNPTTGKPSSGTNGGSVITTPQNSGSGKTATGIIGMSINGIILYGIFRVLMKAL